MLIGWLHLLAFSICYYLTIACNYNEAAGYLAVWGARNCCGVALIFPILRRSAVNEPSLPLARFVVRIWISYFLWHSTCAA